MNLRCVLLDWTPINLGASSRWSLPPDLIFDTLDALRAYVLIEYSGTVTSTVTASVYTAPELATTEFDRGGWILSGAAVLSNATTNTILYTVRDPAASPDRFPLMGIATFALETGASAAFSGNIRLILVLKDM